MEDVEMPNVPGLRKGMEVRVADHIADMLVDRGHAKFVKGKTRDEVEKEVRAEKKQIEKPEVSVSKNNLTK